MQKVKGVTSIYLPTSLNYKVLENVHLYVSNDHFSIVGVSIHSSIHLTHLSQPATPYETPPLPQRPPCKTRQHKARPMNLLVVIPTQLLFLFQTPAPQRLLDIARRVFAADHETDLARGVSGDRGVSVFDDGEDFLAGLLKGGDEGEVEELVFGWVVGLVCARCVSIVTSWGGGERNNSVKDKQRKKR